MKQLLTLFLMLALLPVAAWGQVPEVAIPEAPAPPAPPALPGAQEAPKEEKKEAKEETAEIPKLYLTHADTVTKKLTLPPDRQGREPVVELRLSFNELNNTVWVQLTSARNIFGLQSSNRYEEVFSKGYIFHYGGKFKSVNLPYEVNMDPKNKPRMKKYVMKEIGKYKKRRYKHYLRPWVNSTDMMTSEAPCDMLTTHLERVFRVHPGEDSTFIQLRDLFLLDHKGMSTRSYKKFVINQHLDLNLEYNLLLRRDPCLGKQAEIDSCTVRLAELRQAHATLLKAYPAGKALSAVDFDAFYAERDSLLRIYPMKDQNEKCIDLRELNISYNLCVDSIIAHQRTLKQAAIEGALIKSLEGAKELDAMNLMYKARQLDELTGLWLVAKTHTERQNIRQQCSRVMREAEKLKDGRKVVNDEQRNALNTYDRAMKYYSETVK